MTHSARPPHANEWPATERRKPGWATDWQSTVERDKAIMAQSLHDNTGGLLVAAVMDITWAESHLPEPAAEIKARLVRARAALEVAIDLNRRMIEDLRPTLLDNFGLIAALKWHLSETCKSANIVCQLHLPETSPDFLPAAAIALYRIAQTLIAVMVTHHALVIEMALTADSDLITFKMSCSGISSGFDREEASIADALASITGRMTSLGGSMQFDTTPDGATFIYSLAADKALTPSM